MVGQSDSDPIISDQEECELDASSGQRIDDINNNLKYAVKGSTILEVYLIGFKLHILALPRSSMYNSLCFGITHLSILKMVSPYGVDIRMYII